VVGERGSIIPLTRVEIEQGTEREKEREREGGRVRKNITNNDSYHRRFTPDENRHGFLLYPLRSTDTPYEYSSLEGLQASSTGKSYESLDGFGALFFKVKYFVMDYIIPKMKGVDSF